MKLVLGETLSGLYAVDTYIRSCFLISNPKIS